MIFVRYSDSIVPWYNDSIVPFDITRLTLSPMSTILQVAILYVESEKGVSAMSTVVRSHQMEAVEAVEKPPKGKPRAPQSGKEAILEVLARAADDSGFLARMAENPEEALAEYYVLTWEERAALASGDIKKIEGWVGKLDKRLATWLWCRLQQEKW